MPDTDPLAVITQRCRRKSRIDSYPVPLSGKSAGWKSVIGADPLAKHSK